MGSRTRSTPIFSGKENPKIIKNKLFHLPVGVCPACMFMQAFTDICISIQNHLMPFHRLNSGMFVAVFVSIVFLK